MNKFFYCDNSSQAWMLRQEIPDILEENQLPYELVKVRSLSVCKKELEESPDEYLGLYYEPAEYMLNLDRIPRELLSDILKIKPIILYTTFEPKENSLNYVGLFKLEEGKHYSHYLCKFQRPIIQNFIESLEKLKEYNKKN